MVRVPALALLCMTAASGCCPSDLVQLVGGGEVSMSLRAGQLEPVHLSADGVSLNELEQLLHERREAIRQDDAPAPPEQPGGFVAFTLETGWTELLATFQPEDLDARDLGVDCDVEIASIGLVVGVLGRWERQTTLRLNAADGSSVWLDLIGLDPWGGHDPPTIERDDSPAEGTLELAVIGVHGYSEDGAAGLCDAWWDAILGTETEVVSDELPWELDLSWALDPSTEYTATQPGGCYR